MNWGVYGLIVVFAAFIILLIVNPKLSCFGRRIKSPFYPLFRKHKVTTHRPKPGSPQARPGAKKDVPTDDYGFKL